LTNQLRVKYTGNVLTVNRFLSCLLWLIWLHQTATDNTSSGLNYGYMSGLRLVGFD